MTSTTLREKLERELNQTIAKSQMVISAIGATAETQKREFTAAEMERINTEADKISEAKVDLKRIDEKVAAIEAKAKESEEILTAIYANAPTNSVTKNSRQGFADYSPQASKGVARRIIEGAHGKSGVGAQLQPIPVALVNEPVLLPHQTAWTLTQLIKVEIARNELAPTTAYKFLRQNLRENNAAVVKPGDLKPVSNYDFEEVTGTLKVFAHITDAIHEYWLNDYPELAVAVTEEMIDGLHEALEQAIITGDGKDGHPTGLLNTSGILVTQHNTDAITTIRNAMTSLETIGTTPGAVILNPTDWEKIELARDASGRLEFDSGPLNRAEKRLWGVPVATTPFIEAGTGIVLDPDAVRIYSDGQFNVVVGPIGDDFQRNQVRIRAEVRNDVAVLKPHGIVKVALASE